jgi:hypothetical protein
MQTFLPYADFVDSVRSLDPGRLGKQRVEALQLLRALTFPTYGWQNHPATRMWRGRVPALARYALDAVDAWTALGHADSTRPLITEFSPEAAESRVERLAVPSWLGDEAFHLAHRSNLIRKLPEFYGPRFPDVPDDLPYVWPVPENAAADVDLPSGSVGSSIWVLRPRDDDQLAEWLRSGTVTLGARSPRGKRTPGWLAQLDAFARLPVGSTLAAIRASGERLSVGEVTGDAAPFGESDRDGNDPGLLRRVRFDDEIARDAFAYPALLQDPRTLFEVEEPGTATGAAAPDS